MRPHSILCLTALMVAGSYVQAESQRELLSESGCRKLPGMALQQIDSQSAAIFYKGSAEKILAVLLTSSQANSDNGSCDLTWKDYIVSHFPHVNADMNSGYFVFHVVRWSDPKQSSPTAASENSAPVSPATGTPKQVANSQAPSSDTSPPAVPPKTNSNDKPKATQNVASENWYVYHAGHWSEEAFAQDKRLFGVQKFYFFYIHLNKPKSIKYEVRYEFEITKTLPTNLLNLFALAQLYVTSAGGGPEAGGDEPTEIWGGREIPVDYKTSTIAITPKILDTAKSNEEQALGTPTTFTNESLQYWDVSVGVPIRKMSQLSFNSTDNTVTSQQFDKRTAFALLDVYPKPIDIRKTNAYGWWPSVVSGLGIGSQPLHRVLVGAGYGPAFLQIYAGALFTKGPALKGLSTGQSATTAQIQAATVQTFSTQFAFGINIPVKGVKDKISSSSGSSAKKTATKSTTGK